jgi:serine/threonine protein kinase
VKLRGDLGDLVKELLANCFGSAKYADQSGVSGANRFAKIAVEIALAMQFINFRGVGHGDLKRDSILLGLGWTLRIADFGGAITLCCLWISVISRPSARVFAEELGHGPIRPSHKSWIGWRTWESK